MRIKIKDGRDRLFQWDTGRAVIVEENCDYVHFSNMQYGKALTVDVVDGEAIIPDELLQTGASLFCYAFVGSIENGYTEYSEVFYVEKKPKPTDYVFTNTEYVTIKDLDERVSTLEKQGGGGVGFSPVVEILPIEDGHRVQITDINGVKTFDVLNGKNGINGTDGKNGADGKTPEKGVDYFTPEDIQKITNDVKETIPESVFVVSAVADFVNNSLTGISHSFAEIKLAYERNEHVVLNVDVGQLVPNGKSAVPLVMIDNENAVFSTVVYMGSPVNFIFGIRSNDSYVLTNTLVGQSQIEEINANLDLINGEVV